MARTLHVSRELGEEIDSGVQFYGWTENGTVLGVMGIQSVMDTTLIRHAYVLSNQQRKESGKDCLITSYI